MSQQVREALVASPNTIFEEQSQRDDLLDESKTQTGLIALLSELVAKGHIIGFTAINTDHHNDSELGLHSHNPNGYCADCWPMASTKDGDWLEADDARFQAFLRDAAASPYLWQIGLAGSAWTKANLDAAGPTVFHDDGGDHVHLGAQNA